MSSKEVKLRLGKLQYLFGNRYIKMFNLRRLKLDEEAVYSVTPAEYAIKIVNLIKDNIGSNITITDTTASIGADTISFAKNFPKVNAIELDQTRYNFLIYNLKLANVNNVTTYNGDSLKIVKKINQDVIFSDPQWGGPDYKFKKKMDLFMSNKSITHIVNDWGKLAKMIVLKVPNNFDFGKMKENAHFKTYKQYDLKKFQIIVLKNFNRKITPKIIQQKLKTPNKKSPKKSSKKSSKKFKKVKVNPDDVLCDKWITNKKNVIKQKVRNPITNRPIKINGPVYKKLEKQCN